MRTSTIKKTGILLLVLLAGCDISNEEQAPNSEVNSETNNVVEIKLSPETLNIEVGESKQLSLAAILSDGSTEDITDKAEWSVNEPYAKIDNQGVISGYFARTGDYGIRESADVNVTAKYNDYTAEQTVTVNPSTLESISLREIPTNISLCEEIKLKAIGIYSDGRERDITPNVRWTYMSSSSNTHVTITETKYDAYLSSQQVDSTRLTAHFSFNRFLNSDDISASTNINITDNISSISINPFEKSLALGRNRLISATANNVDGSKRKINVSWSSSRPDIAKAEIRDMRGYAHLTTKSEGTTEIAAECGDYRATHDFTVTPAVVNQIRINIPEENKTPNSSTTLTMKNGEQVQLTVSGIKTNNDIIDISDSINWSFDDSKIATIDQNNILTGNVLGYTVLRAKTDSGFDSTIFIKVIE